MRGKWLAEVQYLISQADASLLNVIDDSVIAQLLSIGSSASSFDDATDSLEAIANAIASIPCTAMRGTDNAFLAAVGGALNDAAATGAVTDTDTAMAYLKQLVTNILLIPTTAMRGTDSAALASVMGALDDTEAAGAVTDADTGMAYLKQLVTAIMLIPTTTMRGTDSAALASSWTSGLATNVGTTNTSVANATYGLSALHTDIAAIPTVMIGTNSAALATDLATMQTDVDALKEISSHCTYIFPAATNLDCVLTAHADANDWSAWAEIVDTTGTPVTLSSKFAASDGHITGMITEAADEDDTIYMVEIAYGAAKTCISSWRLVSGTSKVSSTGQSSARGPHIPTGETIYARVMCETAGSKTLNVHFRYFLHV